MSDTVVYFLRSSVQKNHNQTGGHVAPCVGSEATDTVVKQYSKTYYGSRPSDAHPWGDFESSALIKHWIYNWHTHSHRLLLNLAWWEAFGWG